MVARPLWLILKVTQSLEIWFLKFDFRSEALSSFQIWKEVVPLLLVFLFGKNMQEWILNYILFMLFTLKISLVSLLLQSSNQH